MRGVSRARLDALGSGEALGRTGARAGPRSPHDAPPESDHQQGDERGTEQRLDARKQLRRRCVRRDVRVAQRRERDGAELQMLDEPLRRSKVLATDEYAAGKLIQHRNHISKLRKARPLSGPRTSKKSEKSTEEPTGTGRHVGRL
jgi:hypothetical protein